LAYKKQLYLLFFIQALLIVFVFGQKLLDLNGFMYTVDYDGMKNYFNYLFYASVQEEGGLFDYSGMGYPYCDHLLFMDATTLLAVVARYFVPDQWDIAFYNLFFILNFILGPFLALKIARKMSLNALTAIAFSLFVVWCHPMTLRLGEWSNLSLSIIYLSAIYIVISVYQDNTGSFSRRDPKRMAALFFLVFLSSFIHVYYLLILGVFLTAAFSPLIFAKNKLRVVYYLLTLLFSAACVYSLITFSDPMAELRPSESMGYFDPQLSARPADYLTRYSFMDMPLGWTKAWGKFSPQYLGSYFIILLALAPIILVLNYRSIVKYRIKKSELTLLVALILGTGICLVSSFGQYIMIGDEYKVRNYLNMLYVFDNWVEALKHFRYQSRFGHMAFTGISLLVFMVISYLSTNCRGRSVRSMGTRLILGVIFTAQLVDLFSHANDIRKRYPHANVFSEYHLAKALPDLKDYSFDAILPIPYYNVGSERWGYIIDDINAWSRESYMMSIGYARPLMSKKASRSPVSHAQQLISFICGQTDEALMAQLKGHTILMAVTEKYDVPPGAGEPANTCVEQQYDRIRSLDKELIAEKSGIKYYLVRF